MKNCERFGFEINRTKKSGKFTIVDNALLTDRRLSARARLIMAIVISLPDRWDFSIAGISKISGESDANVRAAMSELAACGYLAAERERGADGRLGRAVYRFYEMPILVEEVAHLGDEPLGDAPAQTDGLVQTSDSGREAAPVRQDRAKGYKLPARTKFQNYTPRKWNYEYLELMEKARLFEDLGRAEEAAHWRKLAQEAKVGGG